MRFAALILVFLSSGLGAAQPTPALSRELQEYLRRPEAQVRVLDGALLICKQAYPDLDPAAERKVIATLAAEFKHEVTGKTAPREQAAALARVLFERQHFLLPEKDDAEAFLLTDVVRNRRGNCLGLSVLCLALAEE